MKFKKYQHIERFGNDEVQGIELGVCYIFPKIDGTNGSIWFQYVHDSERRIIREIAAGSRNRQLSLENDNHGFMKYVIENDNIYKYLYDHPDHRLYGEWLVPHSLKTYRNDAWRKFYVFDIVINVDNEKVEYIPYDTYQEELEKYGIDYIPCIAKITNPSYEQLINQLEHNTFLIQNGKGSGEGIVIKNYGFHNKYGRQIWAKIVSSEFKEKHFRKMGPVNQEGKKMTEQEIVDNYCTEALIEKTYAKIVNECDGWKSQYIPRLLNTVFHDLINEEIWNAIKKMKYPTINFKTLQTLVTYKIKEVKKEIF